MSTPPTHRRAAALFLLAVALVPAGGTAAQEPAPAPPARDRTAWWSEARFGMFIHWGLYAIPAGTWDGRAAGGPGEWILHSARIPLADYEKLPARFDPVDFDAKRWAKIAKDAGMRYLVITSKHHDGFGMWPSAQGSWHLGATPCKRDLLGELAAACRDQGIAFGLYYSIMDWHHPDYLPRRAWDARPKDDARFERYVAYMKAQLAELIERYRPRILWFDGEWEETWTHERGKDLAAFVRGLDPAILVNNRIDKGRNGMAGLTAEGGFEGDFGTPEQEIPPAPLPGVAWESCITMNDTWGFRRDDERWKSPDTLLRMLIEIASKCGNLLLNVGPTPEGVIPAASVERLAAMGSWLAANGEAIYGTRASPFPTATLACTARPSRLYVHLLEWPASGRVDLRGLVSEAQGAWMLTEPGLPLAVSLEKYRVQVALPERPRSLPAVVSVRVEGDPRAVAPPVWPGDDGSYALVARDAELRSHVMRYERDKDCLGFWTSAEDVALWTLAVRAPGEYEVTLVSACPPGEAGSTFSFAMRDSEVEATVAGTGGWSDFQPRTIGRVRAAKPGMLTAMVRPVKLAKNALMNLREIRLTPVAAPR